jgi:hypothetical protein
MKSFADRLVRVVFSVVCQQGFCRQRPNHHLRLEALASFEIAEIVLGEHAFLRSPGNMRDGLFGQRIATGANFHQVVRRAFGQRGRLGLPPYFQPDPLLRAIRQRQLESQAVVGIHSDAGPLVGVTVPLPPTHPANRLQGLAVE